MDVLFLSETWLSCAESTLIENILCSYGVTDIQVFQTFSMDVPPGFGEGRRHGGTAMICRRDGQVSFSQVQSEDPRLLAVRLSRSKLPFLTIVGCYMPYFCTSAEQLECFQDTCASLDSLMCAHRAVAPIVLVGDFNCALPRLPLSQRPAHWAQLRGFNALSREFQRLLDEHDLVIAEFYFDQAVDFTYERGGRRTHIDHIAVPTTFVGSQLQSCTVIPPSSDNLSPHSPLRCILIISGTGDALRASAMHYASSSRSTVLDWSSSERNDTFRGLLAERLACSSHLGLSAEEINNRLTAAIHEAAAESGCSRRRRPPKSWWTPAVSTARDRARFWHRVWTEAGRPRGTVIHDCFRAARSAYRSSRVQAARSQQDSGARLLSKLRRDKNVKAFWRRVELARRGSAGSRSTLTADDFKNHFSPIHADDEQLSADQEGVLRRVAALMAQAQADPGPSRTIKAEDVARLVPYLNRNASPGPDGVTAEHLLFGSSPALFQALAGLLTACLEEMRVPVCFTNSTVVPLIKKSGLDPDCADSYRPISLVCTVSKLLEMLLLNEIGCSFKPSDLQFGFLRNRGTREASLLVQETAQDHMSRRSPLFVANLDARKCFDRLWHAGVLLRASDHMSLRSWALLAFWYDQLTARVRFGDVMSDTFEVRRGVRQGALLSPCLTNMYLLPLIQQLDGSNLGPLVYGHHVPVVAYADDLLLMSSNTRDLQGMLDIVSNFSVKWRLEFVNLNPVMTKSHCFIFGANLLAQQPEWHLCGQTLACKEQTEHLGIQLSSELCAGNHVNARIRRGRGAFFGLTPAGIFSSRLPAPDKVFLWRAVVSPALLFGCSLCFLRSADVALLESWQATAIKAALHLPRTAHHSALLDALRMPRVHEVLRCALFNAFRDAFRGQHRLRSILSSSLACVALNATSACGTGSIVNYMLALCGGSLETLLQVAGGKVGRELVRAPRASCGITDSLRWLLTMNDADSWSLIRLLVMPDIQGD